MFLNRAATRMNMFRSTPALAALVLLALTAAAAGQTISSQITNSDPVIPGNGRHFHVLTFRGGGTANPTTAVFNLNVGGSMALYQGLFLSSNPAVNKWDNGGGSNYRPNLCCVTNQIFLLVITLDSNTGPYTLTMSLPGGTTILGPTPAIDRLDPSPGNLSTVRWRIRFQNTRVEGSPSEPVGGLSMSNFTLTPGGGLQGTPVGSISGGPLEYTLSANGFVGAGTLGVQLANSFGVSTRFGGALEGVPLDGPAYSITGTPPTVTNPTVTDVQTSSARLGGTVAADGGTAITERGVVYSVKSVNIDPTIGGTGVTKLTTAGTVGTFSILVSPLGSSTEYAFKAYARNSVSVSYTSANFFTTRCAIPPTVDAGGPYTGCAEDPVPLVGVAGNHAGVAWSTSGTGTFTDGDVPTATYVPSTADVTAGSVTLTLTATAQPGCSNVSDTATITFAARPKASAGNDVAACGRQPVAIAGSSASTSGVTWTTSGDGVFGDSHSASTTYTPGASDAAAGSAVLTLIAAGIGPCPAATDDATLTIATPPSVLANGPYGTCGTDAVPLAGAFANADGVAWTTSGSGSFADPSNPVTTYAPSAADVTLGSVALTLTATVAGGVCAGSTTSVAVLTLAAAPSATAGGPYSTCGAGPVGLIGSIGNASTVLWTTSGSGSFLNGTTATPLYLPSTADAQAGSVTLTIAATGASACPAATDSAVLALLDSTDADNDGVPGCDDGCPDDPAKTSPGACGCGHPDTDTDGDGTPDCFDQCPNDPSKIAPGACGCGNSDADTNGNGLPDCLDSSAPAPQPTPDTGPKIGPFVPLIPFFPLPICGLGLGMTLAGTLLPLMAARVARSRRRR